MCPILVVGSATVSFIPFTHIWCIFSETDSLLTAFSAKCRGEKKVNGSIYVVLLSIAFSTQACILPQWGQHKLQMEIQTMWPVDDPSNPLTHSHPDTVKFVFLALFVLELDHIRPWRKKCHMLFFFFEVNRCAITFVFKNVEIKIALLMVPCKSQSVTIHVHLQVVEKTNKIQIFLLVPWNVTLLEGLCQSTLSFVFKSVWHSGAGRERERKRERNEMEARCWLSLWQRSVGFTVILIF